MSPNYSCLTLVFSSAIIESMSVELTVEHRAQLHAALADSTRLRIVDHLAYGDASSRELQEVLGIPSNLLAHHVGVLERSGLLGRRRSEADRRRAYLHLVPGTLDDLLPHGATEVPRVVFVCTANSARSQLAAALWQNTSDVPVASAGTHPARKAAPGAVAAARRHGLRLVGRRPAGLAEVLREDDLIVTVCDNAHEELDHADGRPRRLHWSVPDPVPEGTDAAFDAAFDELNQRITHLAPSITTS